MTRQSQFSPDRVFRYTLWREWAASDESFDLFDGCNEGERGNRLGEYLMVTGLNPSTADEEKNDPTLNRVVDFGKRWGFGAVCMTNVFAYRDTLPENMKRAADPIGPGNDRWLLETAAGAGMILAAWGAHAKHLGRADAVVKLLSQFKIHCLRKNKDGSPQHPLYIPADTQPISFP